MALGLLSTTLLWSPIRFPILELLSHPATIVLYIGGIWYCVSHDFVLVGLVMMAVGAYLLREWSVYTSTNQRQIYRDTKEADARFNPLFSVDLQVANHTLVPAVPSMLDAGPGVGKLLEFPPSISELKELNG